MALTERDMAIIGKYMVNDDFMVPGKKLLIIGAGGNWGIHMVVGMALTSGCDLVLVEKEARREAVETSLRELENSSWQGKAETIFCAEDAEKDCRGFLEDLEKKYGPFDGMMDFSGFSC